MRRCAKKADVVAAESEELCFAAQLLSPLMALFEEEVVIDVDERPTMRMVYTNGVPLWLLILQRLGGGKTLEETISPLLAHDFDLLPDNKRVRERPPPTRAALTLYLQRQDDEQLERGRSVVQTPLRIGDRRFARGLGTHSVGHLQLISDNPITEFSAWVGVDHNPRTRGGVPSPAQFEVVIDPVDLCAPPICP